MVEIANTMRSAQRQLVQADARLYRGLAEELGFGGGNAALGLDQGPGFLDGGVSIAQLFRQAAIEPGIGLGKLPKGGAEGIGDLTHGLWLPWLDPGAGAAADSRSC